jgi:hypothetical protein
MQNPSSSDRNEAYSAGGPLDAEGASSAVSWPAIWAGTFAVVALSLILVALGAGLGFASISPWPHEGISGKHFTCMAAVWLIVVQWLSSGLGGYLTGRLRTKWVGVHSHEVFFRDTAHGFLTWAVATVISAIILLVAASLALNGNPHMMGIANLPQSKSQSTIMLESQSADTSSYYLDSLLRSEHPATAVDQGSKAEIAHILAKGMKDGSLPDADRTYLAKLISARTALTLPDAEKKVDDMMAQAGQSADAARKTAASVSIYTFLSMLIGAFIASAAAALGGQQRDEPYPHSI